LSEVLNPDWTIHGDVGMSLVQQKGLLSLTAQRAAPPRVKREFFLLGVGAFKPKFYENGVIPCQSVDTVR